MSSLTFWLLIAAAVAMVLLAANAVVYRIRFGTLLRRQDPQTPPLKRKLPKSEVAIFMLMCLGLLIGVACPTVAPTSAFALWLQEPYSLPVYSVWCWLTATMVGGAVRWLQHLKTKQSESTRS
jgi:hypothetical protein